MLQGNPMKDSYWNSKKKDIILNPFYRYLCKQSKIGS